jgi:hypothetical protein
VLAAHGAIGMQRDAAGGFYLFGSMGKKDA